MSSKYCLMFDFGGVIAYEGEIIKGMDDVIKLAAKDFSLMIVTSMYGRSVENFLEEQGLRKYFLEILGYDVSPSKTEKILTAISEYSFSPNHCLMITDTVGDIHDAREAGIKVVAVNWGITEEKTLKNAGPKAVLTSPDHIIPTAKKIFIIDP